ncbi:MAG: helix-turn-helix transcriptional regulator [Oscillospiraceae bacterium]|nr:helix-turn-helix transcriptional regulator [Oscillospiraceae bacterium]
MIRTMRKKRLLTLEQLAAKSGVSRVSITRYENGQRVPKLDDALKIARALDCTVEELVDEGAEGVKSVG